MAQQADHTDVPLPQESPAQRLRHVDDHQIQNSPDLADDDNDYANLLEHQLIENSFEHVGAGPPPPPPPIADDIHQSPQHHVDQSVTTNIYINMC